MHEDAMEACDETDPFHVGRRIMMRWGKNVKKISKCHKYTLCYQTNKYYHVIALPNPKRPRLDNNPDTIRRNHLVVTLFKSSFPRIQNVLVS